jgi:hypothetical protein
MAPSAKPAGDGSAAMTKLAKKFRAEDQRHLGERCWELDAVDSNDLRD